MGRGIGYGFTAAQRQELWDRYQRGESLIAIARALGKRSSSIYNHLRPSGGIRPAPRRRSRLALTVSEREEISRGLAAAIGYLIYWSEKKQLGPINFLRLLPNMDTVKLCL